MEPPIEALLGATVMVCLVAAVFFARFWRTSGDRFFGFFTAAFVLLAGNWIGVIAIGSAASESRHLVYLLRLGAFVLIVVAIVDKNRRSP